MNARRITFREVLHLLGPLFGAIFAVWLLRLIFAAAGAPGWLVTAFSITGGFGKPIPQQDARDPKWTGYLRRRYVHHWRRH